jgi:uncharacterized integral membrane protein
MKPKVIVGLIILILLAVIMVQNAGPVDFHFLFWTVLISRFIVVPIAFLFGFAFGYLIAKVRRPETKKPV